MHLINVTLLTTGELKGIALRLAAMDTKETTADHRRALTILETAITERTNTIYSAKEELIKAGYYDNGASIGIISFSIDWPKVATIEYLEKFRTYSDRKPFQEHLYNIVSAFQELSSLDPEKDADVIEQVTILADHAEQLNVVDASYVRFIN
jgi:hypothetical protein